MPRPRPRTVPGSWMRGPPDVAAIEAGCYFEASSGELVCDFIEQFCRHSKGRYAGERFVLLPWQREFLMRLFSWKMPDGRRRYRSAYLEVAKKNGKTTLLAALSLALLLIDGEGGPEVHIFAADRDQASLVFDESRKMLPASPAMARRLEVVNSRKVILSSDGKIQANASDVDGADGLNASHIIMDELHRQKDHRLCRVLEYAGIARDQFLRIDITTAGEARTGA